MGVSVILLAAGRSERMGRLKALIDWGGRPLLAYQLEQIGFVDGIDDVVVVTGSLAERLRPIIAATSAAREAHNAGFDAGKAGSVRTGARAVRDDASAVIVLAVDQPRPAAVIRTLLDAHRGARALISLPQFQGRRGHPVIFDKRLLPELRTVDDATMGIRAILERHDSDVLSVAVDDPVVGLDLNTPDDIQRALALLSRRG